MIVISREFSLAQDFRSVQWRRTLWYNLLRAAGAGVIWTVAMLFMSGFQSGVESLLYPVVLPVGYLLIGLPLALLLSGLSKILTPVAGGVVSGLLALCIALLAAIWVAAGDPLVFLLSRFHPQAVPVERPSLWSTSFIVYVLDPRPVNERVLARG